MKTNRIKLVIGLIILFILILGINSIYSTYKLNSQKLVSINKGDGLIEIANNLKDAGVIKNRIGFIVYAIISGSKNKLRPGQYEFDSYVSIPKITEKIALGEIKIDETKITIPEGFNISQIQDTFKQSDIAINIKNKKTKDYKKYYSFLADAPNNKSLEGYLFPDTYLFLKDEGEDSIIRKFLDNFNNKLTDDLRLEIKKQNKTIFEIITMASIIEKEVPNDADRYIVSGILWKRLENNIPLQVDATIAYITNQKTTKISLDDLKIQSPYNTYLNRGLPAGPISNPSISSIKAALYPQKTDYLFYLTTSDGKVIYSKTFDEHIKAKNLYLK